MQIQYYLADGQEIIYQTTFDDPNMEDVDNIAMLYAQKRTDVLPEYVFVSVRIYRYWISQMDVLGTMYTQSDSAATITLIHTAVGPLKIKVMPWASDGKLFLIGRMDDFERYDLDKIFEEVVLKDCEKE